MGQNYEDGKLKVIYYSIAGAIAGVVARIVGQPLDVLKIRFQIQDFKDGKLKYVGVFSSAKYIVKEEGLFALWKGHVPAQFLSVIFGAIQFAAYEKSHSRIMAMFPQYSHNARFKTGTEFICGGFAGISATFVCQPLDVVRTRLVAQSNTKIYKGIIHAIQLMVKENGVRTFYRGLIPTLSMVFPNTGLHFAFYGNFKRLWMHFIASNTDDQDKRLMRLTCGGLSGLCSKLTLLPLDIVKKRLQVQGFESFDVKYSGMMHCFKEIIKKDGINGLYRGAMPSIYKATLVSGVIFFTYEQTCDFFRWYDKT